MKNIKRPNNLSHKFDDLKAPIDKDKLWANIAGNSTFSPPKKNITPRNYLILLAGMLIISIAFFVNTSINNTPPDSTLSSVISEDTFTDPILPIQKENISVESPLPVSTLEQNTEKLNNNKKLKADQTNNKNKSLNSQEKKINRSNSVRRQREYEKTIRSNDIRVSNQSISKKKTTDKNSNNPTINYSDKNQDIGLKGSHISKSQQTIEELSDAMHQHDFILINPLTNKSFRLNLDAKKVTILPVTMIEIHKTQNWRLDISVGRGKHYHSLKDIQESSVNFATWNTNTTNLESYFFNLGLTRLITKGIAIKLEANLTNSFRKFEFGGSPELDTIPDLTRGEGYFSQTKTQDKYIQHHKYQLINANILLEKEVYYEGLSFAIAVGVNVNASIKTDGAIYDTDNNQLSIDSLAKYRTGLGISPMLSAEIRFPLISRFDIFANARYISSLRLSTNNSEVEHSIMALYSNVGVGFRF